MPTFFVASDAIVPPTVRITAPLLHHLRESLRLHPGDTLVITDDRGIRYRTEITEIACQHLVGRILESTTAPKQTGPSLILAQALLKGEKMDWVIQKATELGVDRIAPFMAVHSVVKPRADRVEHQLARWQRIALEAAQQSERWSVPTIDTPVTLPQLLTRYEAGRGKLMLVERSTGSSLNRCTLPPDADNSLLLLIGPEGGWEDQEVGLAREQGYVPVTMGPRILRAETAAIAAISILQARFGQLE
jgi:16S rRNA (uracil1498-N3)-methyltransferase